ncbi:CPBP family intramembrane glutamic endopeptidase [Ulvibacterium sp.]|uniref:CPBP family intramembrane glutamic endopeptidase n=1 Tax=Ulvibacterium sp. TaxID=2665914 RepID=UPI00261AF900|nr:type II CAAX endopeptidase family protein [Ulvibacterium sp.]
MTTTILRTDLFKILLPAITIGLCFAIWLLPLGLDYFGTILAALIIIIASFVQFKKNGLKSLGFRRNGLKKRNILVLAPLAAAGLYLLYYFILIPSISRLTGSTINFSTFNDLQGNLPYALVALVFIWISAAFGEEIIWRGYFMRQFSRIFGEGKISVILNILIFAVLFGMMHSYQGVTGQLITGIIGLFLAVIFQFRKYDLWFNIAVHGFFDTLGLLTIYNGWM